MAPPTTGLAATDATLAAPDGTFIEVVKPWQTWQQADGEEWVKVEVDGSSPLLGAFYLAAGGSRLQRATRSVLEWLGLQGLYLSLSPADDQGQPRLDAMNQCVLLPNTYVRIKDLAVVKWTGSGFTELDSSKYASCYVPAVKPWVALGVDTYTIEREGMPLSSLRLYCEKWREQLGGAEQEPCTSSTAQRGQLPAHIQVHLNDSGELFKYTCARGCKLKTKRLDLAMQHNCQA